MKQYTKKWLSLLYELGKEIRKRGTESPKGSGSYWRLVLPNGTIFDHDDFNSQVNVTLPDGSCPWWGGYFGGEYGNATEEDLRNAIDAVTLTHYPEGHPYIMGLRENLTLLKRDWRQKQQVLLGLEEKIVDLEALINVETQ